MTFLENTRKFVFVFVFFFHQIKFIKIRQSNVVVVNLALNPPEAQ
jgi:hypothetical protein